MVKDTNRRFKIHTDNYRPSKGELILYQVGRYPVVHHSAFLGLVWNLSSRDRTLDSLGVNKSSRVRRFVKREHSSPTDVLDHLIHTLRNDHNTYASLEPVTLSTNIDRRISEKFIISEIEEGVI